MTGLIIAGIIVGGIVLGEGAHKVLEAKTRSKQMKTLVNENNGEKEKEDKKG